MLRQIAEEARRHEALAVALRRRLHRHPELSFQERQTTEVIADCLREWNIPYTLLSERLPGVTGLVGRIEGTGGTEDAAHTTGRTIALRADIDALPMQEASGEAFASQIDGCMHACGHDLHTAMLLVAGKILAEHREWFAGTVLLVFQPAEEVGKGAGLVIQSGLLEGIEGIAALHVDPAGKTGVLETGPGRRTSGGFGVKLTVRAETRDREIACASHLIRSIQAGFSLLQFHGSAVFTPTVMHCHTQPADEKVTLHYDGRVTDLRDLELLHDLTERAAKEAGTLFGARIESVCQRIEETVENSGPCAELALETMADMFGREAARHTGPVMFGEDFRCYRKLTDKLLFALLGCGDVQGEQRHYLHSGKVRFDERAMTRGIAFLAAYALRFLAGDLRAYIEDES